MNLSLEGNGLQPVSTKDRIVSLDVLRGVALMGILLINISGFALPDRYLESILPHPESLNYKVAWIVTVLFEGKMRALFSLIFGASIVLFVIHKEKNGNSSFGIFYRRMTWLALFGLAHAHIFLWGGDILYRYSLCGMILFFFRNAKPAQLIAIAFCICLVEVSMNTYFYSHNRSQRLAYLETVKIEESGAPLNGAQQKAKEEWLVKEKNYFPDKDYVERSIELKRSDYWTMANHVRKSIILEETRLVPLLMIDPIMLMFLGMALYKLGFLSGKGDKRIYLWTMIAGYGIGFPLVLYSWSHLTSVPDKVAFLEVHSFNMAVWIYPVERVLLMLGHVSLVTLLVSAGVLKPLFNALSAVGRMAFSNYILQSIICSFVFFGYGLGYFARFEYYQLFFIVFAIAIVQLIGSPIWLKYFRFGPLEWALRSLTYWKLQPNRLKRTGSEPAFGTLKT